MGATGNNHRGLRLPTGLALLAISVVLTCSLILSVTHTDIDCERASCCLCVGSEIDSAPGGDVALPLVQRQRRPVELLVSTGTTPTTTPAAQFIRAPPEV